MDDKVVIDIISIIIAAMALAGSILTFVYNAILTKRKIFFEIHTNYLNNENAKKACREIKENFCKQHMEDKEESPVFEIWLDQFLFYMNLLIGASQGILMKKIREKHIQYELDVITKDNYTKELVLTKDNHLTYLKDYLEGIKNASE